MNRWMRLAAWLIFVMTLIHACGGSAVTDSTSGNTNWLKHCEKLADCGEGLSCQCNRCQETCTASADCTIADRGSRCAAPSEQVQCKDAPENVRWCVKNCDRSSDCERDDWGCVDGSCVPWSNGAEPDEDDEPTADSGMNDDAIDASASPTGPDVDAGPVTCTQANVELVIPNSGSMGRPFEGQNYWQIVRDTLIEPALGVLPEVESQVRLGLTLYGNPDGVSPILQPSGDAAVAPPSPPRGGGACPEIISVPIRTTNYQSIRYALASVGNTPVGNSPMAEGIAAAADKLDQLPMAGRKVILLTAPGDPDSCLDADSNGQDAPREAAIAAVEAAWQKGIATRVVGLDTASSLGAMFMQRLAVAGAGGVATAVFYDATSSARLEAAYDEIFQSVATSPCEP